MTSYIMYDILKPSVLWKFGRRVIQISFLEGEGVALMMALIRLWITALNVCES